MISRLPEFFLRDGMAENLLASLGYVTMSDRRIVDTLQNSAAVIEEPGSNWELCATTEEAIGYTASSLTIFRPAQSSTERPFDWEIDAPELADN